MRDHHPPKAAMFEPVFQIWHARPKTCRITQAMPSAPYCVTVHDGSELVAQRMFDDHDEAINFAVQEMRQPSRTRRVIM